MVEHIVLFRWKESATPEAIETALEQIRGLQAQFASIVDLTCGQNFTNRSQGYTHGLIVRFTDKAALEGYGPHPIHQQVVQNYINPIVDSVIALDYEF